jgi:hypothetical protein
MTTGTPAKLSHEDYVTLKNAVEETKVAKMEYKIAQEFLIGLGIDYPNSWSKTLTKSGREIRRVDRYGFE